MNSADLLANDELARLDFRIPKLGEPTIDSPLSGVHLVEEGVRVSYACLEHQLLELTASAAGIPSLEKAGPRSRIFHDPAWSRAAIVTCGGLCPGLNDVIKATVNRLYYGYGVKHVFGVQYGYRGLVAKYGLRPVELNPDVVDEIHERGGSILGSSRGPQDTQEIVNTLDRLNINMLFCIGGDGTLRGAHEIAEACMERDLQVSVIGVPKTIDNDVSFVDRTFGFETAVYSSGPVISCAHSEAKGAFNGVGLVKLMGRDSGFIAATACLANSVANFCLIPEVKFELDGPNGFLAALERRLKVKNHAVIVVAEGAGQHLIEGEENRRDASGNQLHRDVGPWLKARIGAYLADKGIDHTVKYFDPSYVIRSVPAFGTDAVFCLHLAENAVHAAMSGRTDMIVGHWNGHFTHVPIALAIRERRKIDPFGQLWQSVLGVTRQELYWNGDE
jgi:6-phosphofructokinase 1